MPFSHLGYLKNGKVVIVCGAQEDKHVYWWKVNIAKVEEKYDCLNLT